MADLFWGSRNGFSGLDGSGFTNGGDLNVASKTREGNHLERAEGRERRAATAADGGGGDGAYDGSGR